MPNLSIRYRTDLVSVDAEQLPCMSLVASRACERLHQELPVDFVQIDAFGGELESCRCNRSRQCREVGRLEQLTIDGKHRALDGISELGPLIALEHGGRGWN